MCIIETESNEMNGEHKELQVSNLGKSLFYIGVQQNGIEST